MVKTIADWLDEVGFGKYAKGFASQDVDLDILGLLTEGHLKELGISLGDRLRLLKAIDREFGRTNPVPPTAPVEPNDPTPTNKDNLKAAARQSNAEKRPLTVMFCDLADSTKLSTQLDPEDLQDVIRTYQKTCTLQIQEYEGFVAKYMGDGILVYYGYPKSLERNGERAVRSALNIVEAIGEINRTLGQEKGVEIAVRVGIATGMVMVGEIVGEGMAQERTVIGEAPNVAARLQGLAGRNGIVVGSLTRELTGDNFYYEDMGLHNLKGISDPVQCWGVTGLRSEERANAHADDHDVISVPVLVGRDEEIGLLRRAWQSTKDESRGQVVTLSGEAGIGKSSLIDSLKAEARAEGLPQLTIRCSPYHTNSTLYPIIEHFKRLARWQPGDNDTTLLNKLEHMLDRYAQPNNESVPLMAALLSLEIPVDRYSPLMLSPKQQKQQTQDMIVGISMEVAERGGFLELCEDLHWADPSTLELIGLLIEQAPTAGLLMVLTARPEFVPPWPMRSHITPITLNRLERPHAAALIARMVGEKPLPDEVMDHIVTKTDGVPLYVEELTKTILTSDILRVSGESYELIGPLESLSIPDTLQESLMARLDRLPQVRELAQLGSVLGREFAYEMLSGISGTGDSVLQEGLEQLVDAELLYQRGRPPRAKYIFKHALVQDAAYNSLLRRTREAHHRKVAELLETNFSDMTETSPEILAYHFGEAGDVRIAAEYLQKAGAQAVGMSANNEAIAHLSKALELVSRLPKGNDRDQHEIDLLLPLGQALIANNGYASPDVEPTYLRALKLCRQIGDVDKEFLIVQGLSLFFYACAEHCKSRELAEQLAKLAKSRIDPGPGLAASRSLGYALTMLGELELARAQFENVTSSYDISIHRTFASQLGGADIGAGSCGLSSFNLFALGFPNQAVESNRQGLELACKLDHPFSEAWTQFTSASVHVLCGAPEIGRQHAMSGAKIGVDKGLPQYEYWNNLPLYWSLYALNEGEAAENISAMRKNLASCRAIGTHIFNPLWLAMLAIAYHQTQQTDEARIAISEALSNVERTGERLWEAEIWRIKGQIILGDDASRATEAEKCFVKAIEVAQSQKAKGWEIRAATSLARHWQIQGKKKDANDLLSPVYNWFTEGFETVDIKNAKALLDSLA